MQRLLGPYAEHIFAITRIIVAVMYLMHGTTKWFDWPEGARLSGPVASLASLLGVAAVIETILGITIAIGLWTRWSAFIASGQMAASYFLRQWPFAILPIYQPPGILGESSVFNCFFFLYLAARGPGIWSIDNVLERRRRAAAGRPAQAA